MSDLAEVIDVLWLYSTAEEDPSTVERAWKAIQPFGDAALEGLIWALQQEDRSLRLLSLRVLREFDPPATAALPAVSECIGSEERLIRLAAIETAGLMRHEAASVVPRIRRHLDSSDELERVIAAGSLLFITGSVEANAMLGEMMTNPNAGVAMTAAFYLRETDWSGKPPADWF